MENWFVVVMGLATVFIVLALIIVLCMLLSLTRLIKPKQEKSAASAAPAAASNEIPNRAEFIAAVSAAIAEASGTDASAIRILSVRKL